MTKVIDKKRFSIKAEENNEMMALGFKYCVEGDWETLDSKDERDGMPNVTGRTHFFTDLDEAKAYANTQTWVFNSNVHGEVVRLTHKMTDAEFEAKEAEKANKKAQKEIEKASEMGMTVEEYKAYKKAEATKKRYAREIEEMEKQIAEMKRKIEYRKNFIANN